MKNPLLLACIALVASACATANSRGKVEFHPLQPGAAPTGPTPAHPVACATSPSRCDADALSLRKKGAPVDDIFRALFAACSAGADRACADLTAHFECPDPAGELPEPPPEFAQAAVRGRQVHLFARCLLGADGLLKDCTAVDSVPDLTPLYLRWLKTWRMRPALLDGQPVTCIYPMTLELRPPVIHR